MRIQTKYAGHLLAGVISVAGLLIVPLSPVYSTGESIVTDLRFSPVSVSRGASVTATFFGADYSDSIYFDVRFRQPESDLDYVALNWQLGTSATHLIPGDTFAGTWIVTGVRPHGNASDHSGEFIPISASLRVLAGTEADGIFIASGSMTVGRDFHTATLLRDGKVLIAGGTSASAELYDPATGIFTAASPMLKSRRGHT